MTLTLTGFTPAGYEISVQVLDVANDKLIEAIAWLDQRSAVVGIRPVCGVVDKNGVTQATDMELPMCPIHNCAMERHEKGKSAWYSHKVVGADGAETWCRGK
jgi:hypothetical protein